ncbi:MAG TPA: S-adenosylmethionine:tRNA ribosyltransferase-isomerase [Flavipsychrobacter sp.]|nr:S-adenosylmethionine:tRNA ribosyltransferase-isomerase [Flavipsychrobacter sp.]
MMHPKELKIEDFTYNLPDEKIAKHPLPRRDASKLLVYQHEILKEDVYKNIASHIPFEATLVFNQTKVIHARLLFQKDTGGLIEVFCLEPHEQYLDVQIAMRQKRKVWWKCMIGGASKWKSGTTLTQKFFALTLNASVVERNNGSFTLELSWDNAALTFAEVLQIAGKVPLPPYLRREAEIKDEESYQTIFAKEEGSVAAPTAGLHFTEEILATLSEKNIQSRFVTLHVGAGTFKPVKSETMAEHEMHAEWIDVPVELIQHLIDHLHKPIVAVGTTSLRTIESLYWVGVKLLQHSVPDFSRTAITQWEPYELEAQNISPQKALQAVADWLLKNNQSRLVTRTQILIAPGYEFKIVKGLITNFHQPQSTLLLLVAAIIGDDWRKVYDYALENNFRFLSYGDGSLLWGKGN